MQTASPSEYETKHLAFVDVETTGLSPSRNDIAEIGVVTVDGGRVERWSTLIKARSRRELALAKGVVPDDLDNAPTFADIAASLAQRLSGRMLVAHNARFDYTFLRTAFQRVDISFEPELICSVMLSRKLYVGETHHNLDSLIERHTLCADVRHRALPDADVLWQWWQTIHREFPRDVIGKAIEHLLAGLVLPPHLDPALIDRLPEAPGAYVFHGEGNIPLLTGAAANLKFQVRNYFRIDQASDKALEHSHRITNITWRVTRGFLGARLHAAEFHGTLPAKAMRSRNANLFTWQFLPDALPAVSVVRFTGSRDSPATEFFGLFASERKARNALLRLATTHRLCHFLLGICNFAKTECAACSVRPTGTACARKIDRTRHLLCVYSALETLRVPRWPHAGPVGIRERSDIHVVEDWGFLGTAQSESALYEILESRPRGFGQRVYRLLSRTLRRLTPDKIINLTPYRGTQRRYTAGPLFLAN